MKTSWPYLLEEMKSCQNCRLGATRLNVVPGEGDIHAQVLFVGEGPGATEDQMGRPFVGAAGQLLDKMLAAIELTRGDVYIANVVKCRPTQNRAPMPDEVAACLPHLRAQTALIRPKIIVCLGASSARALISDTLRITRDRGQWTFRKGVYMLPTYHPAALLRDASKKRDAWADFKAIRDKLLEINSSAKEC